MKNPVIVIIWLMLLVSLGPKVITLSGGFQCHKIKITKVDLRRTLLWGLGPWTWMGCLKREVFLASPSASRFCWCRDASDRRSKERRRRSRRSSRTSRRKVGWRFETWRNRRPRKKVKVVVTKERRFKHELILNSNSNYLWTIFLAFNWRVWFNYEFSLKLCRGAHRTFLG